LQSAINELDSLENDPLIYTETIPRKSYATVSYLVALVMTLLLIIVKTLEARIHD
jgi:hypothetical protein